MGISEKKTQIVINNYFKQECDVNTSIREAFEKGFRIGIKKASSAQEFADAMNTMHKEVQLHVCAAQNKCSIAITPLFETEEYDGYKMRRLGGWHIKISKGSKKIMRIVDACFPSAEERVIK